MSSSSSNRLPLPTTVPALYGTPSLSLSLLPGPSGHGEPIAGQSSAAGTGSGAANSLEKEGNDESKVNDEMEKGRSKDISVRVGSRWISSSNPAKQWSWAPFVSSSRADGTVFRHWVRSNLEYHDYPYAKFDVHLDPVNYNDYEYDQFLKSDSWTKTETDKLMDLARRFDLRWPVIHDRWNGFVRSKIIQVESGNGNGETGSGDAVASVSYRNVEDLQHRYYGVAAIISQARISQEAVAEVKELSKISSAASAAVVPPATTSNAVIESTTRAVMETAAARALASMHPNYQPLISSAGTGSTNKFFDVLHERERRARLNAMWNRSKEEESEEIELRKELRMIEVQLRKLKKSGAHVAAAAASEGMFSVDKLPSNASVPTPRASPVSAAATGAATALDIGKGKSETTGVNILSSATPTPTPGVPYLQSGRLVPPAVGGTTGISKTMAYRMDSFLVDLKAPLRPLPTKRTCDLFDSVRKDTIALLSLRKTLMQKESSLQSKRLKLTKLRGDTQVVDEEVLLGIPPPAPAPPPATTGAPAQKSKAIRATKPKSGASSGKSKAAASNKSKAEDASQDQASVASGTTAAGGGVASTTPGGKKAKTAMKRKRKSESAKSPAPVPSLAPAPAPTPTPASTSSAVPPLDVGSPQPTEGVTKPAETPSVSVEQKQPGGKKRIRKS